MIYWWQTGRQVYSLALSFEFATAVYGNAKITKKCQFTLFYVFVLQK